MFATLIARFALGGVVTRLKAVPRWVWITLASIVVILLLAWWHGVQVGRALAQAHREGVEVTDAAWQKRFDDMQKQAAIDKARVEAAQAKISQEAQDRHEQDLRRIAADASALRLHGPGKAQVGGRPNGGAGIPTSSDQGPQAPGGQPNDPGSLVLAEQWASVPWGWLVDRAEQSDSNRAEVLLWRDWYARLSTANADFRAQASK